jgi:hypothetical protein
MFNFLADDFDDEHDRTARARLDGCVVRDDDVILILILMSAFKTIDAVYSSPASLIVVATSKIVLRAFFSGVGCVSKRVPRHNPTRDGASPEDNENREAEGCVWGGIYFALLRLPKEYNTARVFFLTEIFENGREGENGCLNDITYMTRVRTRDKNHYCSIILKIVILIS